MFLSFWGGIMGVLPAEYACIFGVRSMILTRKIPA